MRRLSLSSTAGGFLIFSATFVPAQNPVTPDACTDSVQVVTKTAEKQHKGFWLLQNASITGGQLTLPFKIRENYENNTFRLTTDVTLGGYVGYTRKLSEKKDYSMTLPLTAGLTFININNHNASLTQELDETEVVPGLTWSTGLIFQLEQYSLGLMLGKDYAGNIGDQWDYHGKLWWSFGVGFVFIQ